MKTSLIKQNIINKNLNYYIDIIAQTEFEKGFLAVIQDNYGYGDISFCIRDNKMHIVFNRELKLNELTANSPE